MSISVSEYKKMLKDGRLTVGKKGRLMMEAKSEQVEVAIPQDLMFNTDDYLFIPGEVYSSKNSTQIRVKFVQRSKWKVLVKGIWKFVTPFVSKSDNAMGYQKDKASIYKTLAPDFLEMYKGQGFPIFIEMIFVRRTRGIWDFNNISQQVCDCMTQAGWLPDDSIKYMFVIPPLPPKLAYYIDKTNPGVYIRVLK